MVIEFRAKTNKEYCMVNTATFHLGDGGTVTIDRCCTSYSIVGHDLSMTWSDCYLWEINGIQVMGKEFTDLSDDFPRLLEGAWIELALEDDADEDYEVTNIMWTASTLECSVSGSKSFDFNIRTRRK